MFAQFLAEHMLQRLPVVNVNFFNIANHSFHINSVSQTTSRGQCRLPKFDRTVPLPAGRRLILKPAARHRTEPLPDLKPSAAAVAEP
jgi:hypothetical protein